MSTPFKGGGSTRYPGRHNCFTAVSVSVSVRSHPKAPPARFFFWCTKIRSQLHRDQFSTGDLDLQGQGQACRGHHLKNHLN